MNADGLKESVAHALCVPRRHSADAGPSAKTGVEKVSTWHVENLRHMNSQAMLKPCSKQTAPRSKDI
jgi:hypothetical protein